MQLAIYLLIWNHALNSICAVISLPNLELVLDATKAIKKVMNIAQQLLVRKLLLVTENRPREICK